MVSPMNEFALDLQAAGEAAKRWRSRRAHHRKVGRAKSKPAYSTVETPERILLRAQRLDAQLNAANKTPERPLLVESYSEMGVARGVSPKSMQQVNELLLERVINQTRDFQFIAFLEQALYVSHAVCRIATELGGGRSGYGTGFLVTPHLLLTNHHVLPTMETAIMSSAEFGYQRDRWGNVAAPKRFSLDPKRFFINNKELDFALVGIDWSRRPALLPLVWCPMIKDLGKIITMEHINIIQHPRGEVNQVVVRENRLLDTFDGKDIVMHYEADTDQGSSGSPVFNDQWEVVALHHSGVPSTDEEGRWLKRDGNVWTKGDDVDDIKWIANEGIRTSKIVHAIESQSLKGVARDLQQEFLAAGAPDPESKAEQMLPISFSMSQPPPPPIAPTPPNETSEEPAVSRDSSNHDLLNRASAQGRSVLRMTIPIHITISVGEGEPIEVMSGAQGSSIHTFTNDTSEVQLEKIAPDKDYSKRPGYDPEFLGFEVPFPKLTVQTRPKAFAVGSGAGDAKYMLDYYHYSIIYNKERKLAFVAGVNYDPTAPFQHSRRKGGDKWFYDPRVKPEQATQAGEDLYARNPLDRGHLVRRADSAWGQTAQEAKLANDDTFHFTNCSPQHEITNQGKRSQAPAGLALWGELETYVASQGQATARRLSIFNGPIFRDNDRNYRGIVKLPKQFWKVIVYEGDGGKPATAAFKLTQANLIKGLEEAFEFEDYQTVQLSVKDLEAETGLNLGKLAAWDRLDKEGAGESFSPGTSVIEIRRLEDIVV